MGPEISSSSPSLEKVASAYGSLDLTSDSKTQVFGFIELHKLHLIQGMVGEVATKTAHHHTLGLRSK